MERREAYERRIWRLAYLLGGGDQTRAAELAVDAIDARPDLAELDPSRLDRLVVLAARRSRGQRGAVRPWMPGDPPLPAGLAVLQQAAQLPEQAFEAWVLARVDGLDEVPLARAMDCSKTAAFRHLSVAEAGLREQLGPAATGAAAAVRALADHLDPGPSLLEYRSAKRARRRRRRLVWGLCAGVAVGLAIAALLAVWGTTGR